MNERANPRRAANGASVSPFGIGAMRIGMMLVAAVAVLEAGACDEQDSAPNELEEAASPLLAEGTASTAAVVRSLAALRGLTGTALPSSTDCNDGSGSSASNCCILVAGYTDHADGGGGLFCYKPASGAGIADNGGTIIKPSSVSVTSAGRWYRSYSGALNAAWFGANPSDTEAVDDAVAITAAMNALPSAGGEIRLPEGTYNLSSAIGVTKDRVRIVGASRATILKLFSTATGNPRLVQFSASHGGLENLALDCNNRPGSSALRVAPPNEAATNVVGSQIFDRFSNLLVTGGCSEGIVLRPGPRVAGADSPCWFNSFEKVDITGVTTGLTLDSPPNAPAGSCNRNQFRDMQFSGMNIGLMLEAGDTNSFYSLSFGGITAGTNATAVVINASSASGADNNTNRFFGTSFEDNTYDIQNFNAYTELFSSSTRFGKTRQGSGEVSPRVMVGGSDPTNVPLILPGLSYGGAPSSTNYSLNVPVRFEVSDVAIVSAGAGTILKSPNGAVCRRLSIDNTGALQLTSVTCP